MFMKQIALFGGSASFYLYSLSHLFVVPNFSFLGGVGKKN